MGYRFERGESVEEAVRRIAGEQLAKALDELADRGLDADDKVHQVRKRCKKLRGLFRLVRRGALDEEGYAAENARYRDAARRVSRLRDADVLIETFDALMEAFADEVDRPAFEPVRAALVGRRDALAADGMDIDGRLEALAEDLAEGRRALEVLPLDEDEDFDGVAAGLVNTYRRARKAMAEARHAPGDAALHDWRKRVKYHGYHTRLLAGAWPRALKARAAELGRLGDRLGDDHDLAVFRTTLLDEPGLIAEPTTGQALLALVDARRAVLQQQAFRLGRRLFAEKPGRYVDRLGAYWDIWQDAGRPVPAVLAAAAGAAD